MAKKKVAKKRTKRTMKNTSIKNKQKEVNKKMEERGFLGLVMWIVGVLVSLAVGFGMVDQVLIVRWIPVIITQIAGWVVVIGALVGVIMAIIHAAR